MKTEQALAAFCARLIADRADTDDGRDLDADQELAAEIAGRLAACGLRLSRSGERPLAVIPDGGDGLSELSLQLLARCTLALAATSARKRARLTVRELHEEFGRPHGYTERFLRMSGLGPLEARGHIKVIKPQQRAAEAYVVAGPLLAEIDVEELRTRYRELGGQVAA